MPADKNWIFDPQSSTYSSLGILPNYSTTNSHPTDNLATQHDTLLNTSVTYNTDTPNKSSSRVYYSLEPSS